MEYNIIKTEATWGERTGKIVGHAKSLFEAEMLKQKLEREDENKWNTYELKIYYNE